MAQYTILWWNVGDFHHTDEITKKNSRPTLADIWKTIHCISRVWSYLTITSLEFTSEELVHTASHFLIVKPLTALPNLMDKKKKDLNLM